MGSMQRVLVVLTALALAVAACGGEPTGSGVLSVTNRSDATVFIRFEDEAGQGVTYRVDPGAVGVARAVDPGRAPALMAIFDAACELISSEPDPALGQLQITGPSSFIATAADDPDVADKPSLPIDSTCQ